MFKIFTSKDLIDSIYGGPDEVRGTPFYPHAVSFSSQMCDVGVIQSIKLEF
jgi:hypothetical protein